MSGEIITEKGQSKSVGTGEGSAGHCRACHHWEPCQPRMHVGYCPLFDKWTNELHGTRCTAFLDLSRPNTEYQTGGSHINPR